MKGDRHIEILGEKFAKDMPTMRRRQNGPCHLLGQGPFRESSL